jgi:hypothetical protein
VLHHKVVTVHHVQAKANVAVTTAAHAATKLHKSQSNLKSLLLTSTAYRVL